MKRSSFYDVYVLASLFLAFLIIILVQINNIIFLQPVPEIRFQFGQTIVTLADINNDIYLRELENQNGIIQFDPMPLWTLTFASGTQDIILRPSDFAVFQYQTYSDRLVLSWTGQTIVPQYTPISVTVEIKLGAQLQNDEGVGFTIQVDNEAQQALYNVAFPNMKIKPIGDSSKNVLFDPVGAGVLRRPFVDAPATIVRGNPSTESSMQFISMYNYDLNKQLYFQTLDSEGYSKDFVTAADNNGVVLGVAQYPENNVIPRLDYSQPYGIEMAVIRGNWYDAAKKYRVWALQQPWASRGKIETAPDFSQTLKDMRLYTLQNPSGVGQFPIPSGEFQKMMDEAIRVKNFFGLANGMSMVHWYGWHNNQMDVEFPTSTTPLSGVTPALTATRAAGIIVMPYTLINSWTLGSPAYISNNVEPLTARDRYGQQITSSSSSGQYLHADIDPSIQQARDLMRNRFLAAITVGFIDGVYFDVWSYFLNIRDYRSTHGHQPGGGNYWAKGQLTLADELSVAVNPINPEFFFTSEHFNELLVNKLDMAYTQMVPMFLGYGLLAMPGWQTVYHDYFMGTDLSLVQPPLSTAYWQEVSRSMESYSFHMGNLVSINNWDTANYYLIGTQTNPAATSEQLAYLNFIKVLVDSYPHTSEYQKFGERLRPPLQSVEYAVERGTFSLANPVTIQASVWKANDGGIGIILTNSGLVQGQTTIQMNYPDYELLGEYNLYENIDGNRNLILSNINGNFNFNVNMQPESIKLFELVSVIQTPSGLSATLI